MTCYLPKLLLSDNASVITILKKKRLQEENDQLQKRITELERIVVIWDFKAKPNIIRQKDIRFQASVDDENNSGQRYAKRQKREL